MINVKRDYSRSRTSHADVFGVYKLTPEERVALGLQEPPKSADLVEVVIPVHRTSSSMTWETRSVPRISLPRLRQAYGREIEVTK